MLQTIEDVIEHLSEKPFLDSRDGSITRSLSKQFARGMGLTDRQLELAKKIALTYADNLDNYSPIAVEQTRLPLRSIDRSKWIRRIKNNNETKLAIRFVFNKKYISKIQTLKDYNSLDGADYDAENKTHYFDFTEQNCYHAVELFKDSDFEIEQDLLIAHKKIHNMIENPQQHVPGIYGFALCNVSEAGRQYALDLLGKPTEQNLHMYYDRRNHLGLKKFDTDVLDACIGKHSELTGEICKRESQSLFVNSEKHTLGELFAAIHALDRFPLLILTGDDPLKEIHNTQRCLQGIVEASEVSVMFRMDNDIYGSEFNSYVKQEGINSPIDKTKKIVYINNNTKLSKPMLKSGWRADAFLSLGANPYNIMADYLRSIDLNIYYNDKNNYSVIRRFGNF